MNFSKLKNRYVDQDKSDVQKFTNKESFVLMKQRKERNYETILPHTRNTRPNI